VVNSAQSTSEPEGENIMGVGFLIFVGTLVLAYLCYVRNSRKAKMFLAPPGETKLQEEGNDRENDLSEQNPASNKEMIVKYKLVKLGLARSTTPELQSMGTNVLYMDSDGLLQELRLDDFMSLLESRQKEGVKIPTACIYLTKEGGVEKWHCGSGYWSFKSSTRPEGDHLLRIQDLDDTKITMIFHAKSGDDVVVELLGLIGRFRDYASYRNWYVLESAVKVTKLFPQMGKFHTRALENMLADPDPAMFLEGHTPDLWKRAQSRIGKLT
jgi:hypothetical protein